MPRVWWGGGGGGGYGTGTGGDVYFLYFDLRVLPPALEAIKILRLNKGMGQCACCARLKVHARRSSQYRHKRFEFNPTRSW